MNTVMLLLQNCLFCCYVKLCAFSLHVESPRLNGGDFELPTIELPSTRQSTKATGYIDNGFTALCVVLSYTSDSVDYDCSPGTIVAGVKHNDCKSSWSNTRSAAHENTTAANSIEN